MTINIISPRNTVCHMRHVTCRILIIPLKFSFLIIFFSKSTFSYYNFSGPCNNEYEFIVHQEHGSEEQEFILKAMNVEDQTHIPGKYLTALKSYDEMLENFRGISEFVIKELYRIYYR